jgi:hypothetical protein
LLLLLFFVVVVVVVVVTDLESQTVARILRPSFNIVVGRSLSVSEEGRLPGKRPKQG